MKQFCILFKGDKRLKFSSEFIEKRHWSFDVDLSPCLVHVPNKIYIKNVKRFIFQHQLYIVVNFIYVARFIKINILFDIF